MRTTWRNNLVGLILLALATIFAQKFISGDLYFYISPRFGWMAILAVVLLSGMAISFFNFRLAKHPADHFHSDHHEEEGHSHQTTNWQVLLVSIPLIFAIFIPAHPLGASQVANQGVSTDFSAPNNDLQISLKIIPAERNVLDWVRAIGANPDPSALNGQQADVIGFVYRDVHFATDQFMIARFAVSCCVADARAIGLVVQTPSASQYPTGKWFQVKGHFSSGKLDSQSIPVILPESIVPVEQPAQPYLYP